MANESDRNDGGEPQADAAAEPEETQAEPQEAPESLTGPAYADEPK